MAKTSAEYQRLNIYLDRPGLRETIKVAAARRGVTVSAFCLEAIRRRLTEEGYLPSSEMTTAQAAAKSLDDLRHQIGPIGLPVRDLIAAGRRE